MAEEDVLTRTETSNRRMNTLVRWGLQETPVADRVEFSTGRIVAQPHAFPERVSGMEIVGGGAIGKADVLRYYLAGYERVLSESPQVRHRIRIIGRNFDADVIGAAPDVGFNNQALSLVASGASDFMLQSRYMQQPHIRSEGPGGTWHGFDTPPNATLMQFVADDFVEAPLRPPMNRLPSSNAHELAHQPLFSRDAALVHENQSTGSNIWSSTGQGIADVSRPMLIPEWFENAPGLANFFDDLNEALKSAREEGGIIPPQYTVVQAKTIIRGLHSAVPRDYSAYLMPDGAIAIDTRGRKPDGALVAVNIDRTVCYSGEKDGQKWHRDYVGLDLLSDPKLVVELCELGMPKK